MEKIDGRPYASRPELMEASGYSRATLAKLWRDRESNGHPPQVTVDGVMRWDLENWLEWSAGYQRARRESIRPVDRSGNPDEELPPVEQARVLGLERSAIAQYRRNPPPGWPPPLRTERNGRGVIEFRTRRQLWEYADNASRAGVAGRTAGPGPEARIQRAVEAMTAAPDRPAGVVARELAAEYGQSPVTWRPIVTEARKRLRSQ
ncbi:hypothetical protein SAMN05216251_12717 [Actinacidiphila alni]|uniref:Uncharacterized protein n=1 Tax=Actinacidiphila alni TaxID=380248 RepID=A0A1I2L6U6_9ACTN|nr:hypothetical protein [Actinacidiphila alni]SFF74663.1 hypothetical protein SAMN05216251_12717 [Actinacidiphila alni]